MPPQIVRRGPMSGSRVRFVSLLVAAALAAMSAACSTGAASSSATAEPWGANAVTPAALVKELASASAADKPVVVYTGPAGLFRSGHIPGAVIHGPAASPDGLSELTAWARSLPRSTSVVIYCGCCPVEDCPNIRPAYTAIKNLGFARVRVLLLPHNFGTDWVAPGYPVEK
ncbi:MAG: rhodanese-like domain-containing protein [Acidobacteriota bacterium]